MAKNKTTETSMNVSEFINAVKDEAKRKDSFTLLEIIKKETGLEPKMWGSAIIGFGIYHYTYESGREGDAPMISFSPRASALTLYLSGSFDQREALLEKLGNHTTGKGCVYIKRIDDIDVEILQKIIVKQVGHIRTMYPGK